MKKKTIIWLITGWIILTLANYYYMPYFILALEWIFLIIGLFILSLIQLTILIIEIINKKRLIRRIGNLIVIIIFFFLTLFDSKVSRLIEKVDWYVFNNRRKQIVEMVKSQELNPTERSKIGNCKLPYEFPVVSNGGNEIFIERNPNKGSTTVTFWIFRNFFNCSSLHFIYTDDKNKMKKIESMIILNPKDNWKIEPNWYRTCD